MKLARCQFTRLACLAVLGALAACSANKKNAERPAELTDFRQTVQVQRVWSAGVSGAPKLRIGLTLAQDGERVFAAGHNGDVFAYDAKTGRRLWQSESKLRITGGPGAGQGLVVVGASHGDIVALDAATGAKKWQTQINSEVLAQPAIDRDVVLIRTVDGRISALKASDGSKLWSAEQQVPKLSLRGTSAPAFAGDAAICGFDNGRVMALAVSNGDTLWDVVVAPPSGRSELERLVDIDSAIRVVDNDIYTVTFQGKAARIDRDTGQLQWERDLSSYSGLTTDEDGLYVTTAEGAVVKIGRRTGVELWKQEVLSRRRLSPPVVLGSLVAVADLGGYVHFLDAANGELAARVSTGGGYVSADPIVVGDTLIVMNDSGKITALRVAAPK
jgi:outer membrane protein assembly factor BamB